MKFSIGCFKFIICFPLHDREAQLLTVHKVPIAWYMYSFISRIACLFVCSDKIVSIGKTVSPRMNHSFGSPWFWPIAGRLTFSKDQFYIDYMFRIKNNKILKGGRFACWSLYPLSSDIFLLLTIIVIFCIVVSKSFLKIVLWHVPWLS